MEWVGKSFVFWYKNINLSNIGLDRARARKVGGLPLFFLSFPFSPTGPSRTSLPCLGTSAYFAQLWIQQGWVCNQRGCPVELKMQLKTNYHSAARLWLVYFYNNNTGCQRPGYKVFIAQFVLIQKTHKNSHVKLSRQIIQFS